MLFPLHLKNKKGKNLMKTAQHKEPLCQSCGMPLNKPDDFGTDTNGSKITNYCHFCFQKIV